jgi:iron complex outermembrane receptor protein
MTAHGKIFVGSLRAGLLCTISGAAFNATSIAHAQTQSAAPPAAVAASSTPSTGTTTLGEIVVTANRSRESLQKIALPISVISGQDLIRAGVTKAKDISAVMPGIEVSAGGADTQIYIRGIGTTAGNNLAEGAVAFNVDGIYISRLTAVNTSFFDVTRVEVLEGPQGTLYGKNATGGAINVITNDPVIGRLGGDESLELGDYGLVTEQAALNIPVNDQVALRAAISYSRHDGYLSDGTDDENTTAGRIKALFKPIPNLSILLAADYSTQVGRGGGAVIYPAVNPKNPWEAASSPASNALLADSYLGGTGPNAHYGFLGPYGLLAPVTNNQSQNIRQWGLGATINWDLGWATVTSITGYRNDPAYFTSYSPGFLVADGESDNQVSQELRLGHQSEKLKWVVGAYYYAEDQSGYLYNNQGLVGIGLLNVNSLTDRSYAVFGQLTYSIIPGLRIVAGDRIGIEKKSILGTDTNVETSASYGFDHSLTNHSDTWKAGLEYDLRPKSMLYFTASTGFKSGGFFPNAGPDSFKPEELTAYELGSKNRFFDNKLEANLEIFYWDYTNRQFNHLTEVTSNSGVDLGFLSFGTFNAGEATLKGFNGTIKYIATRHDTFTAGVEYNDTRYTNFVYTQPAGSTAANPTTSTCALSTSGATQTVNCTGRPLSRAPLWTGSLGYQHIADFSFGRIESNIQSRLSDSYWLDVDYVPNERAPSYTRTDLDVTYKPPVGTWSVSAYVHNLENSAVYTGGVEQPFVGGLVDAQILPPRTYGVRFQAHF